MKGRSSYTEAQNISKENMDYMYCDWYNNHFIS